MGTLKTWVVSGRHSTKSVFLMNTLLPELFIAIHFTLQDMASNLEREVNRDTPDRALNYLKLISSFSFVIPSRYIFDDEM